MWKVLSETVIMLFLHCSDHAFRPTEPSQIHYNFKGGFSCHKYVLKITLELQYF